MSYLVQPFPTAGKLSENLNLCKSQLTERASEASDRVYSYVMSSVLLDQDKQFQQRGSGPNFQGGYITLCTCKHRMRASLPVEKWETNWIAGFTSRSFTGSRYHGRHWLFYLAQVESAYESHSELWHALSAEVRQTKAAGNSRLGDLYEPTHQLNGIDCFDPSYYHTPPVAHSHHKHACDNGWRIDIDYKRKRTLKHKPKRPASLLVGNPRLSFLWREPLLFLNGRWRQKKWDCLSEFLLNLKELR